MKEQIEINLEFYEDIALSLKNDTTFNGEGFIYIDSIKNSRVLKNIESLNEKKLLLNNNDFLNNNGRIPSSIFKAGNNCVTFFIKQEIQFQSTYEHLLVYHGDAGNELLCIGNLFSVNNDEEVNEMKINQIKIDGYSTYIIIKHNKITGL